jgi:hypothetical protein
MSRRSASSLRRSQTASDATSVDPYNQAEQGLQAASTDGHDFRQPLQPSRILSLGPSLRSTDSTLAGLPGESYELNLQQRAGRPLPRQGE